MSRAHLFSRTRTVLVALTAPFGAATLLACDAGEAMEPTGGPQLDYWNGGEPVLTPCNDPTPGEKWSVMISPAGGTYNMGNNTVVVPANAVSSTGMLYLKELSST